MTHADAAWACAERARDKELQISWVRKRLARFAGLLRTDRYEHSPDAIHLYDEIRALAA